MICPIELDEETLVRQIQRYDEFMEAGDYEAAMGIADVLLLFRPGLGHVLRSVVYDCIGEDENADEEFRLALEDPNIRQVIENYYLREVGHVG